MARRSLILLLLLLCPATGLPAAPATPNAYLPTAFQTQPPPPVPQPQAPPPPPVPELTSEEQEAAYRQMSPEQQAAYLQQAQQEAADAAARGTAQAQQEAYNKNHSPSPSLLAPPPAPARLRSSSGNGLSVQYLSGTGDTAIPTAPAPAATPSAAPAPRPSMMDLVSTLNIALATFSKVEKDAWADLYDATGGNRTWQDCRDVASRASPCSCKAFVVCEGGSVTQVRLGDAGLSGSLPTSIGNLRSVVALDVSNNAQVQSYGTVVRYSRTGCTHVAKLSLQLYGAMAHTHIIRSHSLRNTPPCPLSHTHYPLRVHTPVLPQLRGTLPPELGNLRDLERLAVQKTNITGHLLPAVIGAFTKLRILSAQETVLSGMLPPALSKLAQVRVEGFHASMHV